MTPRQAQTPSAPDARGERSDCSPRTGARRPSRSRIAPDWAVILTAKTVISLLLVLIAILLF